MKVLEIFKPYQMPMRSKLLFAKPKTFFLLLFFTAALPQAFPQKHSAEKPAGNNFYEYQKRFYERMGAEQSRPPYEKKFRDSDYEKFHRLEWFMKPRVYPTGNFNSGVLWDEWRRYANRPQNKSAGETQAANWTHIGPTAVPVGGCAGRVNCLEFSPGNSNIIYVGAANGGVWKSVNGGASWNSITDNIPALSIAGIAIDPSNTNTIYIATGDCFGYVYQGDFWGGTYSAGILKTTDGGATWNATGFSLTQSQQRIIHRLVINPSNPQVLFAGADNGLWKTSDGGANWTSVISPDDIYDIEFNPSNPSSIYAAAEYGTIYFSSNGGASWSTMAQFASQPGRTSVAVSAANPNVVYVWNEDGGFYKSTNAGITFSPVNSPTGTASPYGYYDLALNASPTNANTVYAGGLNIAKSTDGGNSWVTVGDWTGMGNPDYVHADNHHFAFLPANGNTVFSCNDGGVFKSVNSGSTWIDLSNGLGIAQYYRLGCSASNANIIYAGQQDQGTAQRSGNNWNMMNFGDGTECAVDPVNSNNVYITTQYGDLSLSQDGGATFFTITPFSSGGGAWVTPYLIHPSNPLLLLGAWDEVQRSDDGGFSWNPLTNNLTSGSVYEVFAAAPSNENYLYAGTGDTLYRTTNGGATWTDISAGLPLSNNVMSYITVSNTNPLKVWVTVIGYDSGNKVFKSSNGGVTWTNVSGTLPNVPVNCIVYHNGTADRLYVGTDFGVFTRDSTMSDWTAFDTGLPRCVVSELEIHYGTNKIRAATYGRGLWESDVVLNTSVTERTKEISFNIYPNPVKDKLTVICNQLSGKGTVEISNVLGEKIVEREIISAKTEINLSNHADGIYFVQLKNDTQTLIRKILISK